MTARLFAPVVAATRNSAVSMPSRRTAKNATAPMATTDPVDTARPTWPSSSPLIERDCLRIQKIIHVSTPAASTAMAANAFRRAAPSSPSKKARSPIPRPTDTTVALMTPAQTARTPSARPVRRR